MKQTAKVDFTTTKGRRKYNYAPLSEVIDACRKALSDNGLAILQLTTTVVEGKFQLETALIHSSGQWITGIMDVAAYPADPQTQGSALTYARRYALSALLGVASEEDDDAESVKGETDTKGKKTPTPPPAGKPETTPGSGTIPPPAGQAPGEHVPKATPEQVAKLNDLVKVGRKNLKAKAEEYGWKVQAIADFTTFQAEKLIKEFTETKEV